MTFLYLKGILLDKKKVSNMDPFDGEDAVRIVRKSLNVGLQTEQVIFCNYSAWKEGSLKIKECRIYRLNTIII